MFLADATARTNLDTAIAVDHAAAVEALCRQFGDRVDLIGFHGQTVYHNARGYRASAWPADHSAWRCKLPCQGQFDQCGA